jgi:hypothetical protein
MEMSRTSGWSTQNESQGPDGTSQQGSQGNQELWEIVEGSQATSAEGIQPNVQGQVETDPGVVDNRGQEANNTAQNA